MDTLGEMVKEILPNGKIRFHRIGGGAYSAVEGENCTIINQEGQAFRGSIIPLKDSTHLYGQEVVGQPKDAKTFYDYCLHRTWQMQVIIMNVHIWEH